MLFEVTLGIGDSYSLMLWLNVTPVISKRTNGRISLRYKHKQIRHGPRGGGAGGGRGGFGGAAPPPWSIL